MPDMNDFSGVSRDITTPGAEIDTPTHWVREETFWRNAFESRPYVRADRGFEFYGPAYRYGTDSALRFRGREWSDVERELEDGWDNYEHRHQGRWAEIKDAVRDAWDRMAHHHSRERELDEAQSQRRRREDTP